MLTLLETFNAALLETFNAALLETFNAALLETFNAALLEAFNAALLETFLELLGKLSEATEGPSCPPSCLHLGSCETIFAKRFLTRGVPCDAALPELSNLTLLVLGMLF